MAGFKGKSTYTGYVASAVTTEHIMEGPENGDWVVAIWTNPESMNVNVRVPVVPPGWTVIAPFVSIGTMCYGIYARKYTGNISELTWSLGAGNTPSYASWFWGDGDADVSKWAIGSIGARNVNGTSLTNVAPSVTPSFKGTAFAISVERTIAAETTEQVLFSSFTKLYFEPHKGTTSTIAVGSKNVVAGSSVGNEVITYPNTHASNGVAVMFVVPDAGAPPVGLPVRAITENGITSGRLQVVENGVLITPKSMRKIAPGYGNIAAMFNETFKIAHRGGSVDFPEMSMFAYTQSVLLGYNALEISLARSSDGVIYGLHDETLLRTSGVDIRPETLTWAETQQYTTFGKPFMTFLELLNAYPNHVLFVDPKHITRIYFQDVLDMMDSYGGPSRYVAKYFGVNRAWSNDAKARGYMTWGYFYEHNSADFGNYEAQWDILGMDYNAPQATWDALKTYNKPIIGHICPNKTAMTTALSKGAVGLMISGAKAGMT